MSKRNISVIQSKSIIFYEFSKEHLSEKYLKWINDTEVNEFLDVRFGENNYESLLQYVESFEKTNSKKLYAIFHKGTNRHIGNASIININRNHENFKFGYLIGDKNLWGSTIGLETILLSLKIGFEHFNLRKCSVDVYSNNIKGRFLLKRVGFYEEGRLKDHLRYKDKFVDNVVLSLTRNQWSKIEEEFSSVLI